MDPWYATIITSFLRHPFSIRKSYVLSKMYCALLEREEHETFTPEHRLRLHRAEQCLYLAWRSCAGHVPTKEEFESVH